MPYSGGLVARALVPAGNNLLSGAVVKKIKRLKSRRLKRQGGKRDNIEHLLAEASRLHREGRLKDASAMFSRALEIKPGWPPVLNALGTVLLDAGDTAAAGKRFSEAASGPIPYAPALYNLGRLCQAEGDLKGAARYYRKAVDIQPGMAMGWNNLGLVLREAGELSRALDCFRRAVELDPGSAHACNNLALCLEDHDRLDEARDVLEKAVSSAPSYLPALYNLGALCIRTERHDRAAALLEKVLEIEPENQSAIFLLQGLGRLPQPDAAPVTHVKKVFDDCASRFESTLVKKLEYRTPEALFRAVRPYLEDNMNILDLGCGTGLGAEYYRPFASSLEGIDASEKMLEQAAGKQIYDALYCRDILSPWNIGGRCYDLIYSSDVFVYFGSLKAVLCEMERHLSDRGIAAFSVEKLNSSASQGYLLRESGRFAHSGMFVRQELENAGFDVLTATATVLRKEAGKDVDGLLWIARKR